VSACNRAQICGRLESRSALRFSPSGMAMVNFSIVHRSEQDEAKAKRKTEFVMQAMAVENVAQQMMQLAIGKQIQATGFLAPANRNDPSLVLHVYKIELIE